jgi:hypothetical protein
MITWIANGLLISGLWGVSNRWRPAFLLQVAGNVLWGGVAIARGDAALATLCAVFILLCLRGFVLWGQGKAPISSKADKVYAEGAEIARKRQWSGPYRFSFRDAKQRLWLWWHRSSILRQPRKLNPEEHRRRMNLKSRGFRPFSPRPGETFPPIPGLPKDYWKKFEPGLTEQSMIVNNKKVTLRYCGETKKYRWTDDAGAVYSPDFDDYFEALAYPNSNELEIQS